MKKLTALILFLISISFPVFASNVSLNYDVPSAFFDSRTGFAIYNLNNTGNESVYDLKITPIVTEGIELVGKAYFQIGELKSNESFSTRISLSIPGKEGTYGFVVLLDYMDKEGKKYNTFTPAFVSYKSHKTYEREIDSYIEPINISLGEKRDISIRVESNSSKNFNDLTLELYTPSAFSVLEKKQYKFSLKSLENKTFNFTVEATSPQPWSIYTFITLVYGEDDYHRAAINYGPIKTLGSKIKTEEKPWFVLDLFDITIILLIILLAFTTIFLYLSNQKKKLKRPE